MKVQTDLMILLSSNFYSKIKLKRESSFLEMPRSLLQEIVKIGGCVLRFPLKLGDEGEGIHSSN